MIIKVIVSALFAVAVIIPPALADEREDVYAGVERWSAAFNSGDVEQIVRMYTDDALVLGTLSPMIFALISRRRQPQNYRLNSATILLLPLQKMLLRSQDFTISQDRQRTANLLLSLHALASSWSKKTAFGRSLIISPRCGRNYLKKRVGKGTRRPIQITFAGIAQAIPQLAA
jgi:hypothetical protein